MLLPRNMVGLGEPKWAAAAAAVCVLRAARRSLPLSQQQPARLSLSVRAWYHHFPLFHCTTTPAPAPAPDVKAKYNTISFLFGGGRGPQLVVVGLAASPGARFPVSSRGPSPPRSRSINTIAVRIVREAALRRFVFPLRLSLPSSLPAFVRIPSGVEKQVAVSLVFSLSLVYCTWKLAVFWSATCKKVYLEREEGLSPAPTKKQQQCYVS